ncbi:MAG TPA: pyridoxamine 5'-phosphate oxidase family protein [Acidimicrobiales bacterium]|nr:pyridoxamine 5'-phosphate oxidase family protein [Acidimicrobiales bacterium]
MNSLEQTAAAFVEMAHRIVWAPAATVDADNRPWTRVLHPLWTWDGAELTGIVATSPLSLKRRHIDAHPYVSFTYWQANHDTCTARCDVEWDLSDEGRTAGWEAFASAPAPVGYDPSIIPGWDSPTSPGFGILKLRPRWLHVMPGTVMLAGQGEALHWSAR